MVVGVREQLLQERELHLNEVTELQAELKERKEMLEKLVKEKINKEVNQPSSKKGEWEKDKPKKKKRKKRRRGRKGAGNRSKPIPDVQNINELENCPTCNHDLTESKVIETTSRIVEDIVATPEKTEVSEEVQERKWCPKCGEIVSSVSEKALPKSDIGLRTTVLVAYFWVVSAISLPGIALFLSTFYRMTLSTAGLSRMMIRLGTILSPVHAEILRDLKAGAMIFADETGWRVHGQLWWLWIFANQRSAYYWADRQRGSPVVEKILGTFFSGILITDAWCAYHFILCIKQTCMAHIFRKIRKFRDAYPDHYTILIFYKRLRRIVEDGEKLKKIRSEIEEEVFERRLSLLRNRLRELLSWKNPGPVLKEIIKKVKRQEQYILTFTYYG